MRHAITKEGLNELALYAGAGGGLLATRWLLGWKTVCYVEKASYPAEVLKARIRDCLLEDAPIWDDARTFNGKPWLGRVDIITAGFPCQPFSLAGKRKGADDERNGWPATIRIIREVRPRYLLLENVPGLAVHPYFGTILGEVAQAGYVARWGVLSAAALGAPHIRERLWIVAHAKGQPGGVPGIEWKESSDAGRNSTGIVPNTNSERPATEIQSIAQLGSHESPQPGSNGAFRSLAHANSYRLETLRQSRQEPNVGGCCKVMGNPTRIRQAGKMGKPDSEQPALTRTSWWDVEPGMGRVAHGVAHRVDRIEALGNGQVPAVVRAAWNLLDVTKF